MKTTQATPQEPQVSDIYAQFGVKRRINAAGTLTRLGGSLMEPEVLQAMQAAAEASVDIAELQAAASRAIATATGAQAGIVTSGASSALTLATAACMARWDVARMAALPDTRGMPHRVLMARTHRNGYDHAVRVAGARIIDIGHNDRGTGAGVRGLEPWEIEAAIDAETAAFVFVATAQSLPDLAAVRDVVHAHHLPLIVDAAAQLPPKGNLRHFIDVGADLVLFSGGKALGGPQASGILAGRADLIGSALVQMMDMDVRPQTWSPPDLIDRAALKGIPHHGIGRGFKVGKEEVVGLMVALQRFVERNEAVVAMQWTERLNKIAAVLQTGAMIKTHLLPDSAEFPVPLLELHLSQSAHSISRRLQSGEPPVHLGERRIDEGILTIYPQALRAQDDSVLARRVMEACRDELAAPGNA